MREDPKSKSRSRSKRDKPRPACEGLFRKEGTAKKVAGAVKRRRKKASRPSPPADVTAELIAERDERDRELAEQIASSFEWRRRSTAQHELALGGSPKTKRTRITVTLEDDLIRTAQSYSGIRQKSTLIQTALKQLIEREAAMRLAAVGGTMPDLKEVPRRSASEMT
jgi:hypothetical protein